ncbi:m7GpppN-mRNA hydrolase-like [Panulirus ornatus]|uniref:m7GpppN-mRNA hydrolase-like n=1 Tax=Panulirus ornatus TaxID=150431 RepID=UPI003A8892E9
MASWRTDRIFFSKELLDDLYSRFFRKGLNGDFTNPYVFCARVEVAHWYYLDECAVTLREKSLPLHSFAEELVVRLSCISPPPGNLKQHLQDFKEYKRRIPTYGAIILSEDHSHILLAKGFQSGKWSFPKGKIESGETPEACAVREVLEEAGYDISPKLDTKDYLERMIGPQRVRLYIIPGVPRYTRFATNTKGEISELRWFPLNDLPTHKYDRRYDGRHGPQGFCYV